MIRFLPIALLFLNLNANELKELIQASYNAEPSKVKEYEIRKADLNYEALFSSYLPNLSINGVYKNTAKDRFLITPKEYSNVNLKLELLLYDGGAREANLNSLSNLKNIEILKTDEFKNLIAFELTKAYFSALAMQNLIKAKHAQSEFLKRSLKRVENLSKAGIAANDELQSILAKYHLSVVEELDLKQKSDQIINLIKLISNLENFKIEKSSLVDPNLSQSSTNYEILKLNEKLSLDKEALNLANSAYYPKFFLQNTYSIQKSKFGNKNNPSLAFIQPYTRQFLKEKSQRSNEFILGFEWKIFDFFAREKKVQIAKITQTQTMLNLEYKKRENETELKNLKNDIEILKEKIKANTLYEKSAQTSLNSVSKKYEAGLVNYTEFLLSVAEFYNATYMLNASLSEIEIKKAEYYLKSGTQILTRIE